MFKMSHKIYIVCFGLCTVHSMRGLVNGQIYYYYYGSWLIAHFGLRGVECNRMIVRILNEMLLLNTCIDIFYISSTSLAPTSKRGPPRVNKKDNLTETHVVILMVDHT